MKNMQLLHDSLIESILNYRQNKKYFDLVFSRLENFTIKLKYEIDNSKSVLEHRQLLDNILLYYNVYTLIYGTPKKYEYEQF